METVEPEAEEGLELEVVKEVDEEEFEQEVEEEEEAEDVRKRSTN